MKVRSVKGVRDILPSAAGGEVEAFQAVESVCKDLLESFGYSEIKIPIFEYTELFARGIGSSTDIVEKEMYTFDDRDGRKISLRPEGTASVVRSLIEHNMAAFIPLPKLYYLGPMFRHERPQAGRYRQFHQIGAEAFGSSSPLLDIEVLSLAHLIFRKLNVANLILELNSLGDPECRPIYRKALKHFLKPRLEHLCENCKRRYHSNPLRVLDCRVKSCRAAIEGAPASIDYLCEGCLKHFMQVKSGLNQLNVPYLINERLVRGLDYYVRTAFEIVSPELGAQNAVAAGGRYDGLVEALGGPAVPGIGFAIGVERVMTLLGRQNIPISVPKPRVFVATLGEEAKKSVQSGIFNLRRQGIRIETDYDHSSLKSQMRRADKLGAKYVLIIGEDELKKGKGTLRDMATKNQTDLDLASWVDSIVGILNRPAQDD